MPMKLEVILEMCTLAKLMLDSQGPEKRSQGCRGSQGCASSYEARSDPQNCMVNGEGTLQWAGLRQPMQSMQQAGARSLQHLLTLRPVYAPANAAQLQNTYVFSTSYCKQLLMLCSTARTAPFVARTTLTSLVRMLSPDM